VGCVAGDLDVLLVSISYKWQVERFAYLVAKALRGDNGDFITYSLVRLEIEGELGVVTLNDDLGGLLHGLQWRVSDVSV
jgi:hypothetical protein